MKHHRELQKLEWEDRWKRFAELNVMQGVEVIRQNPDVLLAVKDRSLTVHGVIYDLRTGLLSELEIPNEDPDKRNWAFAVL